jgi:hypothetical protein
MLKAPAVVAEPIVIRPIVVDARVMPPRARLFSDSEGGDAVLALSVVTSGQGFEHRIQRRPRQRRDGVDGYRGLTRS